MQLELSSVISLTVLSAAYGKIFVDVVLFAIGRRKIFASRKSITRKLCGPTLCPGVKR